MQGRGESFATFLTSQRRYSSPFPAQSRTWSYCCCSRTSSHWSRRISFRVSHETTFRRGRSHGTQCRRILAFRRRFRFWPVLSYRLDGQPNVGRQELLQYIVPVANDAGCSKAGIQEKRNAPLRVKIVVTYQVLRNQSAASF
jgi:hypothetical protein